MRFHCLMVLRDEADIIEQNLKHLLSWADGVYVLDSGSTDDTWERVNELALKDKRLIPFKQSPLVFYDHLRGYVFNQFRDRFDHGDWVLRCDADEFYEITPPNFVRTRLAPLDTSVWLQWYYFRLTTREVANYESGMIDIQQDRLRPIEDRRRHYKISLYSEPRMFRYRRHMKWHQSASAPNNAGFISTERIPIRHYPHRDPMQMESRFLLRARMQMLGSDFFGHWNVEDWHNEIVDDQGVSPSALGKKKSGLAGENGIDTGALLYWIPGTPLPEQRLHGHVPHIKKRAIQRIIHPALLPILDRRRQGWEPSFIPEEIPKHMQAAFRAHMPHADKVSVKTTSDSPD